MRGRRREATLDLARRLDRVRVRARPDGAVRSNAAAATLGGETQEPLMPIAMCATLDTRHAAGTDLVFSVSLALAWKKLEHRFGALRFAPQPALADALSRTVVDGAVSPAWCVADAGFGAEGILERLRSELLSRFSAADVRYLPRGLAPDALLAYGYLSRDLRFPVVFAVREGVFDARPVRAFGIVDNNHPHNAARAAQVIVHEHRSEREFVIELCTDAADEDRLLIAQVPPRERLGETVRDVLDRLGRLPPEYRSLRRGSARVTARGRPRGWPASWRTTAWRAHRGDPLARPPGSTSRCVASAELRARDASSDDQENRACPPRFHGSTRNEERGGVTRAQVLVELRAGNPVPDMPQEERGSRRAGQEEMDFSGSRLTHLLAHRLPRRERPPHRPCCIGDRRRARRRGRRDRDEAPDGRHAATQVSQDILGDVAGCAQRHRQLVPVSEIHGRGDMDGEISGRHVAGPALAALHACHPHVARVAERDARREPRRQPHVPSYEHPVEPERPDALLGRLQLREQASVPVPRITELPARAGMIPLEKIDPVEALRRAGGPGIASERLDHHGRLPRLAAQPAARDLREQRLSVHLAPSAGHPRTDRLNTLLHRQLIAPEPHRGHAIRDARDKARPPRLACEQDEMIEHLDQVGLRHAEVARPALAPAPGLRARRGQPQPRAEGAGAPVLQGQHLVGHIERPVGIEAHPGSLPAPRQRLPALPEPLQRALAARGRRRDPPGVVDRTPPVHRVLHLVVLVGGTPAAHHDVIHVARVLRLDLDAGDVPRRAQRPQGVVPGEEVLVVVSLERGSSSAEAHLVMPSGDLAASLQRRTCGGKRASPTSAPAPPAPALVSSDAPPLDSAIRPWTSPRTGSVPIGSSGPSAAAASGASSPRSTSTWARRSRSSSSRRNRPETPGAWRASSRSRAPSPSSITRASCGSCTATSSRTAPPTS
ncbi:uncharacterized protein SOCEGT47_003270 [Sorangium cellulosum]|uniref:Uncharacterized protein n=1 Tax=Sorangium cellulosum TaxID=56 RepID=A0A4P2PTF9_SORCE|nr:uncharacterized protein SOCEGT47_003270 [Sorangium cellulosum]